jgi:hypothetical protein
MFTRNTPGRLCDRQRVFKTRVLRTIPEPTNKREEVTEGWRKLHDEKFHYVDSTPLIVKGDKINSDWQDTQHVGGKCLWRLVGEIWRKKTTCKI